MHLTGAGIFFSWLECCTCALAQIDKEKANAAASHDRERKREGPAYSESEREKERPPNFSTKEKFVLLYFFFCSLLGKNLFCRFV